MCEVNGALRELSPRNETMSFPSDSSYLANGSVDYTHGYVCQANGFMAELFVG